MRPEPLSRTPRESVVRPAVCALLTISFFTGLLLLPPIAAAQDALPAPPHLTTQPEGEPLSWIQAAARNETRIIDQDGAFPVRYRMHKVYAKGDIVRDVIESRDGPVARLVMRDAKPITAAEDAAERQRLADMLKSPGDFEKKHKRDNSARGYASSLVKLMPQAMVYTYAPGQPQLAGVAPPQVVIDFVPDPKFQPPNMVSRLLTSIEGRLWVDARTHVLTRGEARVRQPIDLGWGMLARIYPGGTVTFEQSPAGDGHWIYSFVEEHLRIREVMVKTAVQDSTMRASAIQLLPSQMSYQQAIQLLLSTPLPTQ